MKTFSLIIILSFAFAFNVYPQKTIKKISKEVCECLEKKTDEFQTKESGTILNECLEPAMAKHKTKLEDEFGIDFESNDDDVAAYQFGVEVAKVLLQDCDLFVELISQAKKTESSLAEDYYNKAEELSSNGQNEDALANYEKAISLEPDNHDYYNSRGVLYYNMNDYYRAISDFLKATEVNPQFAQGYYNLAYTKYQMSDFEQALKDVQTAAELDSTHCDSHNLMGLLENNMENYDNAILSFQAASQCDTTNGTYAYNAGYMLYNNKMFEESLYYFIRAYHYNYSNKFHTLNYLGNGYDKIGDYDKAIQYHNLALQENDSSYIGYYNRAMTNYNYEHYELALADFKKAGERDSTDSDIYLYLGLVYEQLQKNDLAEFNYSKAIDLKSNSAAYYDVRSKFYENIGKYELAIEDSKISLGIYPDDCEVYLAIGRNYRKLKKEEEAMEAFNKSKELGCEEAEDFLNNK